MVISLQETGSHCSRAQQDTPIWGMPSIRVTESAQASARYAEMAVWRETETGLKVPDGKWSSSRPAVENTVASSCTLSVAVLLGKQRGSAEAPGAVVFFRQTVLQQKSQRPQKSRA